MLKRIKHWLFERNLAYYTFIYGDCKNEFMVLRTDTELLDKELGIRLLACSGCLEMIAFVKATGVASHGSKKEPNQSLSIFKVPPRPDRMLDVTWRRWVVDDVRKRLGEPVLAEEPLPENVSDFERNYERRRK